MSATEKLIVLPLCKNISNLVPGEMQQTSNAVSAEKIASAMFNRFAGIAHV